MSNKEDIDRPLILIEFAKIQFIYVSLLIKGGSRGGCYGALAPDQSRKFLSVPQSHICMLGKLLNKSVHVPQKLPTIHRENPRLYKRYTLNSTIFVGILNFTRILLS